MPPDNEYCRVNMEEAQINSIRETGTGNWFLVPYLSKRLGYFKTVDREQGIRNRELVPCSLFGYILPMFQKCISGIRNQFLVPF